MKGEFEHLVIGGLQRSGTSLLRALVGSHPEVTVYQWDLELWTKFSLIYADKALTPKQQWQLIHDVLDHEKQQLADVNLEPEAFEPLVEDERSSRDFFDRFYMEFLRQYRAKTDGDLVGLKTPENEFFSRKIIRKFPKTRFIQVIRNPLDIAVSLQKIKQDSWGGSVNYFSHIRKWKKSVEVAQANAKKYPNRYLIVKYESLIEDPRQVAQQVCDFLQLDFEEEMLAMQGQPGWKGGNSSFKKGNNTYGFKTEAIGRYRKMLPQRVKNYYFALLRKPLKSLDYEAPAVDVSPAVKQQYRLVAALSNAKEKTVRALLRSPLYTALKPLAALFR